MDILPISIRDWYREGGYTANENYKNAQDSRDEIERVLLEIKDSGYRHIFAMTNPLNLMTLMRVGVDVGVAANGEYFWSGSMAKLDPVEEGSDLHSALPGFALILAEADIFSGGGEDGARASYDPAAVPRDTPYDKFANAFMSLYSEENVQFIVERLPEEDADKVSTSRISTRFPAFMYDAVVALGLAACSAADVNKKKMMDSAVMGKGGDVMGGGTLGGSKGDMAGPSNGMAGGMKAGGGGGGGGGPGAAQKGNDVGAYFDGKDMYNELVKTSFQGTSGSVEFDHQTGSRNPNSAIFTITNWLASDEVVDGMVKMSKTTTHVYQNGVWTEMAKFVYNSGTIVAPADSYIPEVNYNYIGTGLRAGALVLCAIVLGLSVGWAIWTKYFEKQQVVRASQPVSHVSKHKESYLLLFYISLMLNFIPRSFFDTDFPLDYLWRCIYHGIGNNSTIN